MAAHFELITPDPLSGRWRNVFKLRVGDYRALYTFVRGDPGSIALHLIQHRRVVYKE